jgi:acrylyl-CoA reductase (NADPH)
MAIGTAGYTAMLAVLALQRHGLTPASGPVAVTGAAGGVGSVAIAILAHRGFAVHAVTGRPQEADYLKGLGATEIIDRKEFAGPARPLAKERWAGAIDAVGSTTLANLLSMTRYGGAVVACGLAGGMDLPGAVAPFILRAVCLYGIDSVMLPRGPREEAWRRLGSDLPLDKLDSTVSEAGLGDLPALAPKILKGEIRGRVVIDVNR